MSISTPAIQNSVAELIRLVKRTPEVSSSEIQRVTRLLRPATSVSSGHAPTIKRRLREQIMQNSQATNANGPAALAEFDRLLDDLNHHSPALVPATLSLLEPLAFQKHISQQSSTGYFTSSGESGPLSTGTWADEKHPQHSDENGKGARRFIPMAQPKLLGEDDVRSLRSDILWMSLETENKILRDLLYIFQGVVGKHIRYDLRSESYVLDPSLRLSHPARDAVLCLCELGWLYSKVEGYTNRLDSGEVKGLIAQAFGFSIQEELHDYYRLLAILEQELGRRSERLLQAQQGEAEGGAPDEGVASSSGLTLLRLRAWMQEPLDRMCLMARLVEGAGPLSGGALASRLHGHSKHGDPNISSLVQRMMNSICSPLFAMINRWVLHGELLDPHKEFFIGYRTGVLPQSMWQETYFLRRTMLPSFLSLSLAQTILVIGKSINFMRACYQRMTRKGETSSAVAAGVNKSMSILPDSKDDLDETGERVIRASKSPNEKKRGMPMPPPAMSVILGGGGGSGEGESQARDAGRNWEKMTVSRGPKSDSFWAPDGTTGEVDKTRKTEDSWSPFGLTEVVEIETSLQALRYGGEQHLSELVDRVSVSIDKKLLRMMLDEFHLSDHFLAMKKFILLGQGDFVTCLMDEIGPELRKRATQLYRHNLSGMLEGALRSSNAQFEPSYVLDRVGVRLLEPTAGDTGWEVFSLDYAVDAPLTAVVHAEAINKYRVAFHMLWRLKRAEWTLSGAWKQLMCFTHTKGSGLLPRLRPVLHRCTLHRARMTHVVNNLCAFLMFEVVESAWVTLQEKVATATCLDDVIKAHDCYLDEIQDRALLTATHEALNLQIQQMIQSIFRFCNLEETLLSDAMSSIARKRALRESVDRRTSAGTWGALSAAEYDDGFDDSEIPGSIDGVPGYVISRLDEAAKDYTDNFERLMTMLKEQGEKAGDIVRYLTFRLDFNGYFSGAPNSAGSS